MNQNITQRRIFKGATTTQSVIRDLLTIVFCQEVLAPGSALIVVAPWISDVTIFDNQSLEFSALNPEWGAREVSVIDVLTHLARAGSSIDIAVRPDEHNRHFQRKMRDAADEAGVGHEIRIAEIDNLHTKGILADSWVILGSMNLTRNGIQINEEYITYDAGPTQIAEARVHFDRLLANVW